MDPGLNRLWSTRFPSSCPRMFLPRHFGLVLPVGGCCVLAASAKARVCSLELLQHTQTVYPSLSTSSLCLCAHGLKGHFPAAPFALSSILHTTFFFMTLPRKGPVVPPGLSIYRRIPLLHLLLGLRLKYPLTFRVSCSIIDIAHISSQNVPKAKARSSHRAFVVYAFA
jgi:hypothetical protein